MNPTPSFFPSIYQAIGITLLVMGCLLGMGYLFSPLVPHLGQDVILFGSYISALGISVWALLQWSKSEGDEKKLTYFPIEIKTLVLITIATIAFMAGIVYPLSSLIPLSEEMKQLFINNFSSVSIFTFLAVVVAAPILEEHIFRGIILDGLLKRHQALLPIIATSILFGIFHANPYQFVSAFLGGLFLGWIYFRFQNLSYCIWIHFLVNLWGFTLFLLFDIEELVNLSLVDLYGGVMNTWVIVSFGIIIFSLCLWALRKK